MRAVPKLRPSLVTALVVLLGGLLTVAGCGGKSNSSQTFTVNVDGKNPKVNSAFIAYYPSSVQVHPGDTVVFDWVGNGEPHTVTLGSTVNTLLTAFGKLPPALQNNPPKAVIALDAKVPQLLPQGPGDALQVAANPCFIASGDPPTKGACPASTDSQPDFDGTQTYYNSGWLGTGDKFTMKLSSSTAPGTYSFMCLLHREGMTGKVVVVDKSTSVPSPSDQYDAGQQQQAAVEAKLAPSAALLAQGKLPLPTQPPGPNAVIAGSASQAAQEAEITEYGPKSASIPVGGSITWWLVGPHSITFNSDSSNNDIRAVSSDGTIHVNPKALAPSGGPGEPPPGKPSASNGVTYKVVASTSWGGTGFLNSGVFVNSFGPPVIEGYKITFTKAGTYKYLCTVHDGMKGTITVG